MARSIGDALDEATRVELETLFAENGRAGDAEAAISARSAAGRSFGGAGATAMRHR